MFSNQKQVSIFKEHILFTSFKMLSITSHHKQPVWHQNGVTLIYKYYQDYNFV